LKRGMEGGRHEKAKPHQGKISVAKLHNSGRQK
jgi:hypothetical protein